MKSLLQRLIGFIYHHVHWWKESDLESEDGSLVYRVRDCAGCGVRQVQYYSSGQWENAETARFSILPRYEAWHRQQFEKARPRPDKSKIENRNSKMP